MKKITSAVLLLSTLLLLSGCGWTELVEKLDSFTIKEPAISTALKNMINKMEDIYRELADKRHSAGERKQSNEKYVEALQNLLLSEESMGLADKRLQKALKNRVAPVAKTMDYGSKELKVRVVSYRAPEDLYDETQRNWTVLQWQWAEEKPKVQAIVQGGSLTWNAAELTEQNGIPTLTLAEYPNPGLPYAKQVSIWQLNGGEWVNDKIENG